MPHRFPVITISRLFGSGGHSIAYALAERLDLPFYDKEIVLAAAEQSGYSEEYVANQGEHRSSGERLLNRFLLANAPGYKDPQEALFAIQRRIILDLSAQPCVIVGRCADYVLRDDPNVALVNLFVHAPMDARIRRESARTNTTPAEAEKRIRQVDKERAAYYNFFSSKRWGDAQAYDLCVNTDGLEISDVVQLVLR